MLAFTRVETRGDVLAKQLGYLTYDSGFEGSVGPLRVHVYRIVTKHRSTPKVALSALVWLLPPTLQAQDPEPLRGTSVQSALKLVCPTSAWCSSTGCAASVSLSRPLSIYSILPAWAGLGWAGG